MTLVTLARHLLPATAALLLAACAGGERAPDLAFTTLDGKPGSFAQLRGKVVLVNFWATSCPSCITEMPKLANLQRTFGNQGYQTVAVAMNYDRPDYVRTYTTRSALPFTVVLDSDGKLAQGFGGVMATPTSFLLDKNGYVVKRYVGEPDFAALSKEIDLRLRVDDPHAG